MLHQVGCLYYCITIFNFAYLALGCSTSTLNLRIMPWLDLKGKALDRMLLWNPLFRKINISDLRLQRTDVSDLLRHSATTQVSFVKWFICYLEWTKYVWYHDHDLYNVMQDYFCGCFSLCTQLNFSVRKLSAPFLCT